MFVVEKIERLKCVSVMCAKAWNAEDATKPLILQNSFPELTKRLNEAFNHEMQASFTYLAISFYFNKEGLRGFVSHFHNLARAKRERAVLVADYLAMRGCRVTYSPIRKPLPTSTYSTPLDAALEALEMERWLNAKVIETHYRALALHDPSVIVFLERHLLQSQALAVRHRGEMVTRLRRVGTKVGAEILNQLFMGMEVGIVGDGVDREEILLPDDDEFESDERQEDNEIEAALFSGSDEANVASV